jgi:hypothetical protein
MDPQETQRPLEKRARARLTAAGLLGVLLGLGLLEGMGCSEPSCEDGRTCAKLVVDAGTDIDAETDAEATPPECVPITNPGTAVDSTCGVFVAKSLGAVDTHPGTMEQPVASLAKAIELALARTDAPRVYACAETFEEAITVPPGVTIYGGLDCENGWLWVGDKTRTTLTAAPGTIPLKMTADMGQGTVQIEDVHVVATSIPQNGSAKAGTSSIAAVADRVGLVDLRRCVLEAGDAVPGANGEEHVERASPGLGGNRGGNACSAVSVDGGAAQVNSCGTQEENDNSIGGKGGDGDNSGGGTGNAGFPLRAENGGKGEAGSTQCTQGTAGDNGEEGTLGMDAQGTGTISQDGYTGVPGSDGGRGTPAQGGGGGGWGQRSS